MDSSVPLTHHDPKGLGLICLVEKRTIHFRILSDLRIQSWIFLKKRTPNLQDKIEKWQLTLRDYFTKIFRGNEVVLGKKLKLSILICAIDS